MQECTFCGLPNESRRIVFDNLVTIRQANFVTGAVGPIVGVVNVTVRPQCPPETRPPPSISRLHGMSFREGA